jgi:hypothetical protein
LTFIRFEMDWQTVSNAAGHDGHNFGTVGPLRSNISAFMNKFRKLGFIEYNGHLEVHTSLLNMVLHETPEIRRDVHSDEAI